MDRTLRDKRAICFFVLPALALFVFVVLVPIVQSCHYSLLEWNGINAATFVGARNFIDIWKPSFGLGDATGHALLLAGLSVFLQLPISLLLALILAMGIRGEKAYRTIYFIPVIISTTIIAQLWMKIYHPSYGILNAALKAVGLPGWAREWLGSTDTALGATFVPMIWQYIGYHMLLFYTAAKSVSNDIYEAARVDGATNTQIALRISIPQMLPMLRNCTIFAVIGSLKSFDLIYVLTKGGPMNATEVPSTLMYNNIFTRYAYGTGSAVAIYIIALCLLFTVVIQRLFPAERN